MTLDAVILISGSFLLGGVPSAYLVGRYIKGIDIRQYGSGNMGTTNVISFVGRRAGLILGVYDCLFKGLFQVILAKVLDEGLGVQIGVGFAAVIGHSWSPYMRFTGGRGLATFVGMVLGLGLFFEVVILVVLFIVIGRSLFREMGFWALMALVTLPILSFAIGREVELVYMGVVAIPLLLLKRVTANWETPCESYTLFKLATNRILWDRDISSREEWVKRRPTC